MCSSIAIEKNSSPIKTREFTNPVRLQTVGRASPENNPLAELTVPDRLPLFDESLSQNIQAGKSDSKKDLDIEKLLSAQRSHVGWAIFNRLKTLARGTVENEFIHAPGFLKDIVVNDPLPSDEGIDRVIEVLKNAKHEICIQTFIFDFKSEAGKSLLAALKEKQAENPNFRIFIVLNKFPNGTTEKILSNFQKHGVNAKVSLHPKGLSRASLHTKSYIIDAKIAYVGGDNVDNPPDGDLLIGVQGMIVSSLLTEFDSAYLGGEIWGRHRLPPALDLAISHAKCPPSSSPSGIPVEFSLLSKAGIPWLGKYYENDADQAIFAAIDAAEKEVKIVSPNFNDKNVWSCIIAAARRGVKVKILIPKTYLTFPSLVDRATNMAFIRFRDLHKDSTINNIELRWFSTDGEHKERNHAKYVSVDGVWAYVGSQNFDNQSFSFSREMGLGIDSSKAVEVLDDEVFNRFWLTSLEADCPAWVRLLPAPSINWLHRIARITLPPLLLVEKVVEWLKSKLI